VATAYVEAFDKFANMLLTDVEETYTVRTKTATEKRTTAKLDNRTRHIQQVFLRGEQVVSISVPSAV
jgi:small nuclear ribonucleoprotein (snRNP)-like protein